MTEEELWKEFTTKFPQYKYYSNEAFMLDDSNDNLLNMILDGAKTSISSLKDSFLCEEVELPRSGELSIIDDSKENARCVIISKGIKEVALKDVTSFDAVKEGFTSLEEWKNSNLKDFTEELKNYNKELTEETIIIFEDIEVLYKID